MTRTTNARLAGFMFLFYIATAFPGMVMYDRATKGDSSAAKLASIAAHIGEMRIAVVLSLITIFDAIVLAVALYAITRHSDRDLALIALACRIGEGLVNCIPTMAMLALLWVAKGSTATTGDDVAAMHAFGASLLKVQGWGFSIGGTLFAVGSTLYAYLFLRARTIPGWLAWLGLVGSLLIVIGLPLQMTRLIAGPATSVIWLPIAAYEIILGFWLLIKGIAPEN